MEYRFLVWSRRHGRFKTRSKGAQPTISRGYRVGAPRVYTPCHGAGRRTRDIQEASDGAGIVATLTTAIAAHSLLPDQAKLGYPVHLHGVVTDYDPDTAPAVGAFFACDQSGCICVLVPPRPVLPLRAGMVIDMKGVSKPGNYAPIVIASEVHAVGQSHLPSTAPRRSLAQLMTGADDGQWVEVEGVIHSVAQSGAHITLALALADGEIRAITTREAGVEYARLVDATVVIRGIIQDGNQGLFIPTVQKTPTRLEEVVDVVGFPTMGEYSLKLEDAIFLPKGSGQAVAATSITVAGALKGEYDSKLVQIQGRLVNQDLTAEYPTLVMSSGGMLFLALRPRATASAAWLRGWIATSQSLFERRN